MKKAVLGKMEKIRGPMGPGLLTVTSAFVTRRGCLPQNINPISPTIKSILGITQIITKAYQNIAQFQCLTFKPNPKGQGCA